MSSLYQERLLKADINISAAGDNIVIAAPTENSSTYIAIDFISFIPSTSVTVQMKDGATAYGGALSIVAQQPLTWENAIENTEGIITLSPNSAFVINLSGAAQVSGFIRYRLMSTN